MPMAEVGRQYVVGMAKCYVPNVCADCGALLASGLTVKVEVVTSPDNKYRTRIDPYCDPCGVRRKVSPEPLQDFT